MSRPRSHVRAYSRTINGRRVQVRDHDRTGRPGKGRGFVPVGAPRPRPRANWRVRTVRAGWAPRLSRPSWANQATWISNLSNLSKSTWAKQVGRPGGASRPKSAGSKPRQAGQRKGKGKRGKQSLGRRGWTHYKKAAKHGVRKHKWRCAGFAALGTVEVGSYALLNTLSFALISIATIAIGTAAIAVTAANAGGKR